MMIARTACVPAPSCADAAGAATATASVPNDIARSSLRVTRPTLGSAHPGQPPVGEAALARPHHHLEGPVEA